MRKGNGLAIQILEILGVDLGGLMSEIERSIAKGKGPMIGLVAPNDAAKRVLEKARAVAVEAKQSWVDTGHLLLALILVEETLPANVLHGLDIVFERAHRAYSQALGGTSPGDVLDGEPT